MKSFGTSSSDENDASASFDSNSVLRQAKAQEIRMGRRRRNYHTFCM
jgi:hypothetical protein